MSVRVGVTLGPFPFSDPAGFWRWVDLCEDSAIDSIWFSDRLVGAALSLEPLSGLAAIAGRTRRLKSGPTLSCSPPASRSSSPSNAPPSITSALADFFRLLGSARTRHPNGRRSALGRRDGAGAQTRCWVL